MSSNLRTLLVIGKNHEEIAHKYSLDLEVPQYVRYYFDKMDQYHNDGIKVLERLIKGAAEVNTQLKEKYLKMYQEATSEDSFEYYKKLTYGCDYDDNGNALSTENPNAHYQYEKCYNSRILKNQDDEAPFSNPFILNDGSKAYVAKNKDIAWERNHMCGSKLYVSAWNVCVNGKEPENEDEKLIKERFSNRKDYFSNFKDCNEYVAHSCSFWTYGIATNEQYISGTQNNAIDWTVNFYDRYIKNLDPNETLSIYEIKLID